MDFKKFKKSYPNFYKIFTFLLENSTDLIIILNDKFELEWFNTSDYRDSLGYESNIIGQNILSLIHPDDKAYTLKEIKMLLANEKGKIVVRIKNNIGVYHFYSVFGHFFQDQKGKAKILFIIRENKLKRII